MSRMQTRSFEDIARAFHEVAQHLGVPVEEVSRRQWKRAVKAGARFSVGANAAQRLASSIGGWAELRRRVVEAGDQFDAVRVAPLSPLPEGQGIHGVSTLTDGHGNVKLQWIKTRAEDEQRAEMYRALFEELASGITPVPVTRSPEIEADDLLALYPIGDPHIGLHTWAQECGDSFDLKICESLMTRAVDHLVTQGPRASKAIICTLGDTFHADDMSERTRRSGHKLDVDGRWAKVLGVGLRIFVTLIQRALEAHNEVEVRALQGNHDDHSSTFLQIALDAYFRDEPRVNVIVTPRMFQYARFGRVLLGFTHGHTVKQAALGEIMATDRAEDWGATTSRHWHVGHFHSNKRVALRGCSYEIHATLASPDAYAIGAGYRSDRDMKRVTYHREWGEVARNTITAQALQAQMAA